MKGLFPLLIFEYLFEGNCYTFSIFDFAVGLTYLLKYCDDSKFVGNLGHKMPIEINSTVKFVAVSNLSYLVL